MKFKEAHSALIKNEKFKEWKKAHQDSFLSSLFLFEEKNDMKVAYYNPKNKKITTFSAVPYEELPEDDVLAGHIPKQLDITKVKTNLGKAKEVASEELNKKGKQIVNQTVIILQQLEHLVYNFTFVTMTFNIVNIRVDAISSKVIKTEVSNLMDFGKMA